MAALLFWRALPPPDQHGAARPDRGTKPQPMEKWQLRQRAIDGPGGSQGTTSGVALPGRAPWPPGCDLERAQCLQQRRMAGGPARAPCSQRRPPRCRRPPACRQPAPTSPPAPASLQAAAQYIEEHNLQKVVEDAINATIKEKPSEPFSYMVRPPNHLVNGPVDRRSGCTGGFVPGGCMHAQAGG